MRECWHQPTTLSTAAGLSPQLPRHQQMPVKITDNQTTKQYICAMEADQSEGQESLERLSSNVMNYLVWRYLQEAGTSMQKKSSQTLRAQAVNTSPIGYAKTAKQLQYQWVGKDESPESLPFVANIKKGCLVHLAQDGLFLDHLQAEVKKVHSLHFHLA
jgi:hypothetical protein